MFNFGFFRHDTEEKTNAGENPKDNANDHDEAQAEQQTEKDDSSFNWAAITPVLCMVVETVCQVILNNRNRNNPNI